MTPLQPMETAPKDGRWIEVELPDTTRRLVHWAAGYVDDYQPAVPAGWYFETPNMFAPLLQKPVGWRPV